LFKVHSALRNPLGKGHLAVHKGCMNDLLHATKQICLPYSPSNCESIKCHWPRHWGDTRRELGCSAAEKSLGRKLGESQKRNLKFTSGKQNAEVGWCHLHVLSLFFYLICANNFCITAF
jgi:hypothetical protein